MSVEERLRGALRDQAASFTPPVETALDRLHARRRTERWRSAAVAVAASAAVVAVVAGALATARGGIMGGDAPPADRPTASTTGAEPSAIAPLRGSIVGDVDQPAMLGGRWTLDLNGNGTIDVSPPARFDGRVSGPMFTADGGFFRTSLFQDDLCARDGTGIYTWVRVGEQIDFEVLSDRCAGRARFFADSTWTTSTAGAARD